MGSTNGKNYLRDETGNRRFWPQACAIESIDTAAFAKEVDQVWAEAVQVYRKMRLEQPHGTLPLYLQGEALGIALDMQESRRVETPSEILAGRIRTWLAEPVRDGSGFDDVDDLLGGPVIRNEVSLAEIWVELLGRDFSQMDQRNSTMLGNAMQHIDGWVRARRTVVPKYGQQVVYRRVR
jgi:hypothetical protein